MAKEWDRIDWDYHNLSPWWILFEVDYYIDERQSIRSDSIGDASISEHISTIPECWSVSHFEQANECCGLIIEIEFMSDKSSIWIERRKIWYSIDTWTIRPWTYNLLEVINGILFSPLHFLLIHVWYRPTNPRERHGGEEHSKHWWFTYHFNHLHLLFSVSLLFHFSSLLNIVSKISKIA